jgi:glycosyltransferase involved in cell wall biosynthesis
MEKKREVSAVIAVYNDERYLGACIECILAQTFTNFELIIIDDGSDDATPSVIDAYARRDPRIKTLRNAANMGISYSRNRGTECAQGRFLAVVDSDDEILPERFEEQYSILRDNPDLGGVGTSMSYIGIDGETIDLREGEIEDQVTAQRLIANPMALIHGTLMMRRECLVGAGGYRSQFVRAIDYDMLLRMTEKYRFAQIRKPLTKRRVSFTSGTIFARSIQIKYVEISRRLHDQRVKEGSDVLQRNDTDAFEALRKEVFGLQWKPKWMVLSANYLAWAHRMYHRGPLKYARMLAARAVRSNPLNLIAWGCFLYLFLPDNARKAVTRTRGMLSGSSS